MTRDRVAKGDGRRGHELDRVGDLARASGLAAVAATLVPVVGDLVAVPLAALAIVLGVVGIRRYETGRADAAGPAVLGAFLGLAAVLVVALMLVMTHVS